MAGPQKVTQLIKMKASGQRILWLPNYSTYSGSILPKGRHTRSDTEIE